MNLRIGTRLWSGLLVLVVVLWATGLLVLRQYPGLPTPPELTLVGLPIMRYTRDIASMITLGSLVVGGLLVTPASARVQRWATTWALVWLITALALLAFTISDTAAVTPLAALSVDTWLPFMTDTLIGRVFAGQFIAIAVVLALSMIAQYRTARSLSWITVIIAATTCAAPALLGHGGITAQHVSMTISLGIHITAVSLWVGGLAVCVAYLAKHPEHAAQLIPRFSVLALWCVIALAETGLLNASLRLGSASVFVGTLYGSLVLVKVVLLGWLIRIGWQQRRGVVPIAADQTAATALLGRFAGQEMLLMSAAIAISIALSRIGIESATNPTGAFNPIAILALAIVLPLLVHTVLQVKASTRALDFLRSYPEIASVVLLVVIVEVAGLRILSSLLGLEPGVMLGACLLIAAGWLWVAAIDGPRRMNGVAVVMIGYPVATIAASTLADSSPGWRLNLVCIAAGEAILIGLLARSRATAATQSADLEASNA
ncbi:MAG: CopD family protein [Candidatus Nanopelagicales bacterium]